MDNNKETFEYNDENCGGCGCGCSDDHGHDHEHAEFDFEDMDNDVIYLTLDDDTEIECNVLGIFDVEDKEYIALLPMGEEEVLLYQYVELADEDFDLLPIEDEAHFNTVSKVFEELFMGDEEFVEYENYEESEEK